MGEQPATRSAPKAPTVALFDNDYAPTLAFLTSLGAKGIRVAVYGSAACGIARWSRYCARYAPCPPIDRYDEFLPWLRTKIRSGEITHVAPTSDLLAYYVSVLRDEFAVDVRRTIPTLNEIETCLIKTRFAEVCKQLGHPVPESYAPTDLDAAVAAAESIGYPLMLKPKSHLVVGIAERGFVVNSSTELRKRFRPYPICRGHEPLAERYPELLLPMMQRFIPSAQRSVFSVSGIKDADRGVSARLVSVKREQWPPRVGVSMLQVSCIDDQVLQAGISVVDGVLGCGIFEIEMLVDGERCMPIDLNPRGFGFMALDVALGNDIPWLWLQSTRGPIDPVATCAKQAQLECRLAIPFYLSHFAGLLRGPCRMQRLAQIWREFRQPSIAMMGYWRDPIPALLAKLTLLKHPRSLLRACWNAAALNWSDVEIAAPDGLPTGTASH